MAITLFGTASSPADNGTAATDPTIITPPSDMQKGDLVFVTTLSRLSTGSLAVSQAGGQTWNSLTQVNQTLNRARSYWCVFNGTWTANPSFSFGGTTNNSARMLVWRPNSGVLATWLIDVAEVSGVYAAPGATPWTVTITGITTITNGALVIAGWTSADDNTWGGLTAGWTAFSPAQVRNLAGSDASITHAWFIDAVAGATGNVAQNQTAVGGDAGTRIIIAFKEIQALVRVKSEEIQQVETTLRFRGILRIINELLQPYRNIIKILNETLQSVESTLKAKGFVKVVSEQVQNVETIIRELATAGNAIIKIINERLEHAVYGLIIKVINETVEHVENRIHILTQGGTASIIRIINEVVNVIEGPFQLITGLLKVINETSQVVETRLTQLAAGLIKVINESISLIESRLNTFSRLLLEIIEDTLELVEGVPIHTAIAIIAKKSYAAAIRAIRRLWWRSR